MDQPKFKENDKVYSASSTYVDSRIECPDCEGSLKWTVRFADDHEEEIDCQTCREGFYGPRGYVVHRNWKPSIELLTIKSIKGWEPEKGYYYFCKETSSGGSGRIHREYDLFPEKQEAEKKAEEKYKDRMKHIAQNNFSKRNRGKERLERLLSTIGFTRSKALRKAYDFIQWAEVSELIGKTESKNQYSKVKIEKALRDTK